jgi:hypothetical protein
MTNDHADNILSSLDDYTWEINDLKEFEQSIYNPNSSPNLELDIKINRRNSLDRGQRETK